jgi:hypothetical protein
MVADNKRKTFDIIDCIDPYPWRRACKVSEVNLPTNI